MELPGLLTSRRLGPSPGLSPAPPRPSRAASVVSSAFPSPLGPPNNRTILTAEGADPDGLEALARAGVRYIGSDTTHIFCLPTCHDARRVTERHLQRFHSSGEAHDAGYRPCKHCRPLGAVGAA